MSNKKTKTPLLKKVGLWATIWWAVSGLYVLAVVWEATKYYAQYKWSGYFSLGNWRHSIYQAGVNHQILVQILVLVLAGWLIIGFAWLRALKLAKVSYKAGLKDLFFTLR